MIFKGVLGRTVWACMGGWSIRAGGTGVVDFRGDGKWGKDCPGGKARQRREESHSQTNKVKKT